MKFIDCNHQANIIHQYIEEQLHHSYLKEYIDQPYIDRDRIYFLLLPFVSEGRAVSKEVVQWISTAMLLQIALDTHEKVTISERDPLKERQLTVLAGVYFSSLYYKILAETDDVELISRLAKAIKEINESKISIYKEEHENLDALMKRMKTRESAIVSNFYHFFEDTKWIEIVEEILLCKKLVQEKICFEHLQNTSFLKALTTLTIHSDQEDSILHLTKEESRHLLSQMDELIEGTKSKVRAQLETIEPGSLYFKKLIVELLPYEEPEPMTKLYAEEG
ncbi:heptaprenyl diphosphate synthase component 1 [Rossellomorea aquimaris]|uniref:heptaprenyl diphosphate synthase component 1 n=1 Tax=Rossellomorea TaxID=2837508 RepID=UPI001CD76837|nr:heptaprenyl diphosphate synthase component 1 [Rossellomorea aquimaris]MCA1058326.1 heptaprenyl diphosphate synthase component 1 [Rossellomorea aquimaris]